MPTKLEDRPPFVTFETRSVEDREASIAKGHYVGRDVDYALITPAGSKDRIERVVAEWFEKLKEDVAAERFPAAWVQHFREAYHAYKAGRTAPENGTSILDWPALSPSQTKTLLSLNIRTVEDVAVMNEESIARLGMGGRALKQRAQDWLTTAQNIGQTSETLSALRVENARLQEQNQQLDEKLRLLSAQVELLQKAGGTLPQPVADTGDDISLADLDLGSKL